jgi:uncharacterized protein YkwD
MLPRRLLPLLLVAGALSGAAPAAAAPPPACPPGLGARPLTVHTLCLINRTRADHGLHRLRFDPRLRRVARGHSRDMVGHHYFSHASRSGLSSAERIARTGWMRGRDHWRVGENLAWRAAPASPRSVVQAWLDSPAHRHVLLEPSFRVIGIGIVRGTPFGETAGGATYTADFGS